MTVEQASGAEALKGKIFGQGAGLQTSFTSQQPPTFTSMTQQQPLSFSQGAEFPQ